MTPPPKKKMEVSGNRMMLEMKLHSFHASHPDVAIVNPDTPAVLLHGWTSRMLVQYLSRFWFPFPIFPKKVHQLHRTYSPIDIQYVYDSYKKSASKQIWAGIFFEFCQSKASVKVHVGRPGSVPTLASKPAFMSKGGFSAGRDGEVVDGIGSFLTGNSESFLRI